MFWLGYRYRVTAAVVQKQQQIIIITKKKRSETSNQVQPFLLELDVRE